MNFFNIVKKNFNLLINAKFSSFVFIFGPLILILLVGSALSDTSIKNINSGAYFNPGAESFSNAFIGKLNENSFNVIKEENLDKCKQEVINGDIHVCIEVSPSNFNSLGGDYSSGGYDLKLYVDFSQQRIVWNVIGTIQHIAELESESIRNQRIDALKSSSSDIVSQIQNQQANINLAIGQVNSIETSLDDIQNGQSSSKESLYQLDSELSILETTLRTIQSSGELDSHYSSIIGDSLFSLQTSRSKVSDLLFDSTLTTNLNPVISSVSSSKDNLLQFSNYLDSLQKDISGISGSDLEKVANPISVSYFSVLDSEGGSLNKNLQFLDYIFPSFLLFFILFSSLIYSAINVIRERKANSYVRNISSKMGGFNFVFSNFVTSFIVVFIQISAILFLASFFVNISLTANVLNLALFLVISISIFSLVGTLIGMAFNSLESASIGAISLSLLFFMFSSIIAPVETLPRGLSRFISLTPFAMLESKARFILIFESGLRFSSLQTIVLGSIIFSMILLIFYFYRISREKEI